TAMKFYTEDGNWDLVGNNTPVFFMRDPKRFPDLNHVVKRDPRTNMNNANSKYDFWSLLPESLHQVTIVNSRSEEHTSELQSRFDIVCRLLLEKKKKIKW